MEHSTAVLIMIVAAAGFGLLAQVLAHRWRIPAIFLLLVFGILLGQDVIGLERPKELGDGLGILVKLAVAIILFEGALNLNIKSLKTKAKEVRNLVTVGVLVSWGTITLIAHYVAKFEWPLAILFGALMTVTGPTVIQPLLRRLNIPHMVKTVLEAEAILVDPIGAIMAIAVLDVIVGTTLSGSVGVMGFLWAYFGRVLIGGAVGAAGAFALARLLKNRTLVPLELSNLVALACVWATFGLAEWIEGEAGIMAVVVMGLVAQNAAIPGARQLRNFKETLTTLGISMLFILLAANLELTTLWQDGGAGFLAVLLIMFVARPLAVFISTWRTGLSWREKVFISWVGPRGIIAASVASIFTISLANIGYSGGDRLLALTFLTILMTVTIQGLTAGWVAKKLGLQAMDQRKVMIVGANGLACTIAQLLVKYNRPTTLIDTNPSSVEKVRKIGVEAVTGNALEEEILEELHLEEYSTFLAVTSNSEVNVLACQLARDSFRIERAFPALSNPVKGANTALLNQTGGRLAFGRFITIADWEKGDNTIHEYKWQVPANRTPMRARDTEELPRDLIPVIRVQKGAAEIVHSEQTWLPGDTILFLCQCSSAKVEDVLARLDERAEN